MHALRAKPIVTIDNCLLAGAALRPSHYGVDSWPIHHALRMSIERPVSLVFVHLLFAIAMEDWLIATVRLQEGPSARVWLLFVLPVLTLIVIDMIGWWGVVCYCWSWSS